MPSQQRLTGLIDILLQENATETEWLVFKSNYVSPQDTGEYISALSNGAALKSRPFGYLVFGIDDVTHEVGNTTYDFQKEKVGNENLENWLRRLLSPDIPFTVCSAPQSCSFRNTGSIHTSHIFRRQGLHKDRKLQAEP